MYALVFASEYSMQNQEKLLEEISRPKPDSSRLEFMHHLTSGMKSTYT